MRDPYTVLGVSRTAEASEIKAAFRRLAREHHPDRNPDDGQAEQRFREVNDAYQVLSDPERRARFDQFGSHGARSTGAGASWPGAGPQPGFVGIEDILGDILGAFGRRPANRGDMRLSLQLSFRQAALGCEKSLTYERLDRCAACGGDGAQPGAGHRPCRRCSGSGHVVAPLGGLFGARAQQICPGCAGRGQLPITACSQCEGRGLSPRKRTIEVTVPAGIESGAAQIVTGGGSRLVPGAEPGDLELVIQVQDDPLFTREGDDVHSELTVSFVKAALGGEVSVETLHGPRPLHIPPGSRSGDELQLRGEGVPHRFRRGAGHHCVRLKLAVPKTLSPRARELLQEYEAALHEGDSGLLGKLKSLWQG